MRCVSRALCDWHVATDMSTIRMTVPSLGFSRAECRSMASTISFNRPKTAPRCHCCNLAACRVAETGPQTTANSAIAPLRRQKNRSHRPTAHCIALSMPARCQLQIFAYLMSGEHAVFTFASFSLGQRQLWRDKLKPHRVAAIAGLAGCSSWASIAVLQQHHNQVQYIALLCRRTHSKTAAMASNTMQPQTTKMPR